MKGSAIRKKGENVMFFNDPKQLLKILEIIVGEIVACRAGEIFSSERSHRKKFSRHLKFFMQWKTGEREKVLPRG